MFREGHSLVMFTSDVSARGMDYPDVTSVIQVGQPADKAQYVHRLGRTARAGKQVPRSLGHVSAAQCLDPCLLHRRSILVCFIGALTCPYLLTSPPHARRHPYKRLLSV